MQYLIDTHIALKYNLCFFSIFAGAIGLSFGSFFNVMVYRIPKGRSLSTPSACPVCGTRIKWYDNIPVLGYLLLKGHCRCCKSGISPFYPIMEAGTGLLFAIAALFYGYTNTTVLAWIVVFVVMFAVLAWKEKI